MVDLELAERLVDFLNELADLDKEAINALIRTRVGCNQKLLNHPTVQVSVIDNNYTVGILGILNGLCGVYSSGYGPIAAILDYEKTPPLKYFMLTKDCADNVGE